MSYRLDLVIDKPNVSSSLVDKPVGENVQNIWKNKNNGLYRVWAIKKF